MLSRRPLTKNKQHLPIFFNKSIIIWRPGVSKQRYTIIVHPIDECMHVLYIVCLGSQCTKGKYILQVSYRGRCIERNACPALYMCGSSIDQSE